MLAGGRHAHTSIIVMSKRPGPFPIATFADGFWCVINHIRSIDEVFHLCIVSSIAANCNTKTPKKSKNNQIHLSPCYARLYVAGRAPSSKPSVGLELGLSKCIQNRPCRNPQIPPVLSACPLLQRQIDDCPEKQRVRFQNSESSHDCTGFHRWNSQSRPSVHQ